MAALTLGEVKLYLRVSGTDDDAELTDLMESAKFQIIAQTGKRYAGSTAIEENAMFKTAQKQLVAQAYTNKEGVVNGTPSPLQHSAETIIEVIKNTSQFSEEQNAGT